MAKTIDCHLVCMTPGERVLARLVRRPRTRVRMPFATERELGMIRSEHHCSGGPARVVDGRMGAVAWRVGVAAGRRLGLGGGGRVTERLCVITSSLTQRLLQ